MGKRKYTNNSQAVLIATLVISTAFVAMRYFARYIKLKRIPFELEDIFIVLAVVSWAITAGMYLKVVSLFYDAADFQIAMMSGKVDLTTITPADQMRMMEEGKLMLRLFFVIQIFFWTVLWCVKLSLMFQFKKLTKGAYYLFSPPSHPSSSLKKSSPNTNPSTGIVLYERIWWGVLTFIILTYIGSQVTNLTSCASWTERFDPAGCRSKTDLRNKDISLYFSLGCDLLTDILIMAIPIQVLVHLRISTAEKISVAFVFLVGIITMVAAIVRCVSLKGTGKEGGNLSVPWLIFWAAIECSIGMLPRPPFSLFRIFFSSRAIKLTNGKQS